MTQPACQYTSQPLCYYENARKRTHIQTDRHKNYVHARGGRIEKEEELPCVVVAVVPKAVCSIVVLDKAVGAARSVTG